MPDDKRKKIPQDAKRISLTDPDEVRYWCNRFDCEAGELEEAVREVGDSADAVAAVIERIKQRRRGFRRIRIDSGRDR